MPAPLVLAMALLGLSLSVHSPVAAQGNQARLLGRVTDDSGAALPGATVSVSGPALAKPIAVVTDSIGQYQTPPLPPGTYTVSFEMSGFAPRVTPAVVLGPGEVFVLDRQLGVAQLTETVMVTGAAPKPPPAAPLPPLRKRPETVPIPKPLLASVCGPDKPADADITVGHIVGHRDEPKRELFGPGDVIVLDVGAEMGMKAGDNYVVRRRFQYGDRGAPLKLATFGGQTAGLLQVVETTAASAVAVVMYACAEFMAGDSLAPFEPLPVLTADGAGEPQFDDPARIAFGELGRLTGATNQLMVIDRGYISGVVRGQRVTIFRQSQATAGPAVRLGDGVVVAVRQQSATIRIERSNDAIEAGALVALHR